MVRHNDKRNASTSQPAQDESGGSYHLVECSGLDTKGSQCQVWSRVWVPERVPADLFSQPFLCGFCCAAELVKAQQKVEKPWGQGMFEADAIEQYGRRENIRIHGLEEVQGEDPYKTVTDLAESCGVPLKREEISVCHRLPTKEGVKPLIVKFVRREKKIDVMYCKKKLKEQKRRIFLNEDVTPLRARLMSALRKLENVKNVHAVNEKIVLYDVTDRKFVYNTLYELQNAYPNLMENILQATNPFR